MLIVEADGTEAVVWTKPTDLRIDLKKPIKGLGTAHKKGFHGLYADGSVRFVPGDVKPFTLKLLLQRSDGQVIPPF